MSERWSGRRSVHSTRASMVALTAVPNIITEVDPTLESYNIAKEEAVELLLIC